MIQATIYGNIGGKIEKKTWNSTDYLTFSLAVNKGKDKKPDWVDCTLWHPDIIERFENKISTGDKVLCQGNLSLDEYTTKKGVLYKSFKLRAANISLLKKKSSDTERSYY